MLSVTGIFRGIKTVPAKEPGKPPQLYIGIASNKTNGYPGEEDITDVRMTKDQMQKNFGTKFNTLQDKMITLPIFITSRAWKERAYVDYYCAGDPQLLVPEKKLVAAG